MYYVCKHTWPNTFFGIVNWLSKFYFPTVFCLKNKLNILPLNLYSNIEQKFLILKGCKILHVQKHGREERATRDFPPLFKGAGWVSSLCLTSPSRYNRTALFHLS